ncbi:unnamed protein product, partial [Polarella glacialis]
MLLSLALTIAERRRRFGAESPPGSDRPYALVAALPPALVGAALVASLASSLGVPVSTLLPQSVRNCGESTKTYLQALGRRFEKLMTGDLPPVVTGVPPNSTASDEHPAMSPKSKEVATEGLAKPKKIRITAFDSIRFFLISYIMCGHFIGFAEPARFAFKAITQINVVVGAFFALSGYVAAYSTTELQEHSASEKMLKTPSPKWILQKIFGYYPLHLLVLTIFSPMFLYSDVHFSGWPTAIFDGLLEVTLSQAWFPLHAEVWNAPTWFLSALSYATVVLRFAIPVLATQTKRQLRHSALFLFLASLLPKLGYCDDHDAWGLLEGSMALDRMPNVAVFNTQRFNPLYASFEVLLGAVACRLVMLDGADGEDPAPKTNAWSTLLPLLGMIDVILLRARGRLHLSDVLSRGVIFIPLFLLFLMSTHRASVKSK